MRGKSKYTPAGDQRSLFPGIVEESSDESVPKTGGCSFEAPHPGRLYFGDLPLIDYLQSSDMSWVVNLARYLRDLDWSAFEAAYHRLGRRPLHPRIMVGLVVYGYCEGVTSLRGLERLASKDLAAIYLCGGVRPDHSTIGNFILRHAELLKNDLFEQTLMDITDHVGLCFNELSGDGTVVQSWGSHYRALEKEALEEARRLNELLRRMRDDCPDIGVDRKCTTDAAPEDSDQ